MNWEEYKEKFKADGNAREIHIHNTDLNDWRALVDFLRSTDAVLHYYYDGKPAELPKDIQHTLFDTEHLSLMTIGLDEITVKCRFMEPDEIALKFVPEEVDGEARAKIIFRLMSTAGRILKKSVILTSSGHDKKPLVSYEPGEGIKCLN